MVTMAPRQRQVVTALLFCLSCLGLILFMWLELGGSSPFTAQGYRVHVLFQEASSLFPGAQVRISGVNVGRVVATARRGVDTDATVELSPPYAPLRSDARAILRQKTLLGEMFIALTPGSPTARPVPDGGTLAPGRVMSIQPLDEVLNAFDPRTRQRFQQLLLGVAGTLSEPGASDLNEALGESGPAAAQLQGLLSTLDGQSQDLRTLVRDSGTVLDAVSRRQSDLQSLVVAGDALLSSTAAHDRGVTRTVQALEPLLSELRLTLAAADRTAGFAAPTLTALQPVAPLLSPALAEALNVAPRLSSFLRELDPFLAVTRRSLPAAQKLLTTALPLMRQLYPAAQQIVPVIAYMSAYRRELVAAMANVGAATQATAPSMVGVPLHYMRFVPVVNNESFVGAAQRLPSNRHNAYYAPGELARLGHGGLQASDCANTSNPSAIPLLGAGTGSPPCLVAPPWLFASESALFHRLAAATP